MDCVHGTLLNGLKGLNDIILKDLNRTLLFFLYLNTSTIIQIHRTHAVAYK